MRLASTSNNTVLFGQAASPVTINDPDTFIIDTKRVRMNSRPSPHFYTNPTTDNLEIIGDGTGAGTDLSADIMLIGHPTATVLTDVVGRIGFYRNDAGGCGVGCPQLVSRLKAQLRGNIILERNVGGAMEDLFIFGVDANNNGTVEFPTGAVTTDKAMVSPDSVRIIRGKVNAVRTKDLLYGDPNDYDVDPLVSVGRYDIQFNPNDFQAGTSPTVTVTPLPGAFAYYAVLRSVTNTQFQVNIFNLYITAGTTCSDASDPADAAFTFEAIGRRPVFP